MTKTNNEFEPETVTEPKLSLRKRTLRNLTAAELELAHGGEKDPKTTDDCELIGTRNGG